MVLAMINKKREEGRKNSNGETKEKKEEKQRGGKEDSPTIIITSGAEPLQICFPSLSTLVAPIQSHRLIIISQPF